jgi:hypothetical protein
MFGIHDPLAILAASAVRAPHARAPETEYRRHAMAQPRRGRPGRRLGAERVLALAKQH